MHCAFDETFSHVKFKGFMSTTKDSKSKLNFDALKDMIFNVNNDGIHTTTTQITREPYFKIVNKPISKKFNFTFTKRVLLGDGSSLPYGHKNIPNN